MGLLNIFKTGAILAVGVHDDPDKIIDRQGGGIPRGFLVDHKS
jgi:hypothetical protein